MTGSRPLDIGEIIRRSGVPATTLHVWERAGLLHPIERRGLRRQYGNDVLETIAVIVVGQRAGFTLDEIRRLLEPDAFASGKQLLVDKLAELERERSIIDTAIDGLRHALDCDEPSPLACPRFHEQLADVLPVERPRRT